MWVHSTSFSCTGQDGELAAIVGIVLCADRYVVRLVEDPVAPADKTRLSARPVPALHPRTAEGFGQNVAVGPPRCTEIGSWGPSPQNGWWVPFAFFHSPGVGFRVSLFLIHRRVPGVRFSTASPVACPPLSLPSTSQTQLDRAFLGPNLFVLIFFDRFLGFCGQSACVPHLPVGSPFHPWRGLQPLWKNDGWITIGWYHFW